MQRSSAAAMPSSTTRCMTTELHAPAPRRSGGVLAWGTAVVTYGLLEKGSGRTCMTSFITRRTWLSG